jgi:hypothetical protein
MVLFGSERCQHETEDLRSHDLRHCRAGNQDRNLWLRSI